MDSGGPLCNIILSCLPAALFSDQEHLDKEIERLRNQLKVKVNRLFEAQGIGLQGWEASQQGRGQWGSGAVGRGCLQLLRARTQRLVGFIPFQAPGAAGGDLAVWAPCIARTGKTQEASVRGQS